MTRFHTRKLSLQALEDRRTPSVGTFVEDFTNDSFRTFGGYDTHRDGVQISHLANAQTGAGIVINSFGSPGGTHALRLKARTGVPEAYYLGWVYYTAEGGGLAPWEQVTSASVTVRGPGTVTFTGMDDVTFTNTTAPDQWVTFQVGSNTRGENGQELGSVTGFRVNTQGEMLVDDVTVTVEMDPRILQGSGSEVRVARFGDGLGVYGSAGNDLVRVDVLYDAAGTVRISGLSGTRIKAMTPEAIQVSDSEVEIPDFARIRGDTDYTRDILINLRGGDDALQVHGTEDWIHDTHASVIDNLFINTGGGESLVEFANLFVKEHLSLRAGGGVDRVTAFGGLAVQMLDLGTAGGDDVVWIGRYLPDQHQQPVYVGYDYDPSAPQQSTYRSRVDTGAGDDRVWFTGGQYEYVQVILGSGGDTFRLESAWADHVRVRSGLGFDSVTLQESTALGFALVLADANDALRLDRVNFNTDAELVGTGRVKVQFPTDGTTLDGALTFLPTDSVQELRDNLLTCFVQASWPKIAVIEFDPFWGV